MTETPQASLLSENSVIPMLVCILRSMENDSSEEVLIVGAGPVGLTLAGELARYGIRPCIIDRLSKPSPYCRAIGVTPPTLEVWEDMGIARDMIDAGIWLRGQRSIVNGQTHDAVHDLSDLPFSTLGIPQYATERLLAEHLASFGIQIERGTSLESITQSDGHVQTVTMDAAGNRQERTLNISSAAMERIALYARLLYARH